MQVYQDYIRASEQWTADLGWWHSVLYCYAVCLRTAPLYSAFTAREAWGDDQLLRTAEDLARRFLTGETLTTEGVDDCYSRLEQVIPDSETFPDSSAACDTGIIHLYTLSLLRRHDPKETQYVASYCYDLVDAAAGDEILPEGIMTPEVEAAIGGHPIVLSEVAWQARGRELLSAVPKRDMIAASEFLTDWTSQPVIRTKGEQDGAANPAKPGG